MVTHKHLFTDVEREGSASVSEEEVRVCVIRWCGYIYAWTYVLYF